MYQIPQYIYVYTFIVLFVCCVIEFAIKCLHMLNTSATDSMEKEIVVDLGTSRPLENSARHSTSFFHKCGLLEADFSFDMQL